ncbi:MAG: TldD/PmbA family protein [Armatimonadetes bacterium]|nr:TldD/PmbA family protein [Armatimonadota bacterium]
MSEELDTRAFCERVLERAKAVGASYADVRIVRRQSEVIDLRTGKVERLGHEFDRGFGVRVIADGSWGFSASPSLTTEEAERIAEEAVRIARASALTKRKDVLLAPIEPVEGSFSTDWKIDPFDISLEEKIGLLKDADRLLRENEKIKVTDCSMDFWSIDQVFASTDGSYIEQKKIESGGGIAATAIEGGEVQKRSYPASFGGDYAAAGYEFVESLKLIENAEEIAREAVELLKAPVCPSGEFTLILEGSMLALQVHESCGHPIELDRVFGTEASFAGTSFLTTDKLGSFKYGSDLVNITADATLPGGMGSFYYDDEGVPAQRVDIIKEGIFSGYLSSRETAAELAELTPACSTGETEQMSGGAMRADGWDRIPLIRMTNINLLPGDWEFDELIADTTNGIYAAMVKSWSIDDKRLNFQFGTEVAWEIKDGALGRMFKNPIYNDITPRFWSSCDAICGESDWHLWGVPNCGKGEPMQVAHVGHGVAPARFRNVRMEGAK